jgi:hypothetical protein
MQFSGADAAGCALISLDASMPNPQIRPPLERRKRLIVHARAAFEGRFAPAAGYAVRLLVENPCLFNA